MREDCQLNTMCHLEMDLVGKLLSFDGVAEITDIKLSTVGSMEKTAAGTYDYIGKDSFQYTGKHL